MVDEFFNLDFIAETANVIIIGQNGTGKTMLAKNLAHQGVLKGHSALYISASELLNDLAAQDSASALTASHHLNNNVVPFFEEQQIPLLRVITDRRTEFCSKAPSGGCQRFEQQLPCSRLSLELVTLAAIGNYHIGS